MVSFENAFQITGDAHTTPHPSSQTVYSEVQMSCRIGKDCRALIFALLSQLFHENYFWLKKRKSMLGTRTNTLTSLRGMISSGSASGGSFGLWKTQCISTDPTLPILLLTRGCLLCFKLWKSFVKFGCVDSKRWVWLWDRDTMKQGQAVLKCFSSSFPLLALVPPRLSFGRVKVGSIPILPWHSTFHIQSSSVKELLW